MYLFVNGVVAMGSLVAALFFQRLGEKTRDRLFTLFAVAFTFFALERLVLSVMNTPEAQTPAIYLMRLAGFLCIIVAIIRKNLEARR
jgi:uncharacterized membrane protein YqgA involved in biofilm formation